MHREWDDEFVVFNDLTGDCHLLDAGGFAILRHLQAGVAAALAPLATALAEQFDDIDVADPAILALLEQTLARLAACDLVEALA